MRMCTVAMKPFRWPSSLHFLPTFLQCGDQCHTQHMRMSVCNYSQLVCIFFRYSFSPPLSSSHVVQFVSVILHCRQHFEALCPITNALAYTSSNKNFSTHAHNKHFMIILINCDRSHRCTLKYRSNCEL